MTAILTTPGTVPAGASPSRPSRPTSPRIAALALLGVTAAWGSSFILLKDLTERIPVPDLLALRFVLAAVALYAVAPTAVRRLSRAEVRAGVLLGLAYGAGQIVQTVGLQTTSASVSGFITGMYVVFTPLLGAVLLRTRVSRTVLVAVVLSTLGLGVISLQGLAVGGGEALTLVSAALYALHILGTGLWSRAGSALGLTVVQLATVAVVCSAWALPDGLVVPSDTSDWVAVLHMAVIAGALALVVQTWAQAHLSANRAAVVMTMEPVFAGVFAVLLGGEILGPRVLVGGGLVLAAMYLVELGPRSARPNSDGPGNDGPGNDGPGNDGLGNDRSNSGGPDLSTRTAPVPTRSGDVSPDPLRHR